MRSQKAIACCRKKPLFCPKNFLSQNIEEQRSFGEVVMR
jgi:hypothetical protein